MMKDCASCSTLKCTNPDAVGKWLKRKGNKKSIAVLQSVMTYVNLLILHRVKRVTLDIDVTLSASNNCNAFWTYKKVKGYMPMVGHIAETGTILAVDFREGNISPKTDNHEFIKQGEDALPDGVRLQLLRADSAAYQGKIIDDAIEREVGFAIRAVMHNSLREEICVIPEDNWQLACNRKGDVIEGEHTCRIQHSMHSNRHAFTVIVQRSLVKGQLEMDLPECGSQYQDDSGTAVDSRYIYRAIATNRDHMSNDEIIHWYNQRGDCSENRIKDFKEDFGGDQMPCQDFNANNLYFSICALAYNLLVLLRTSLPAEFETARAKKIRYHLYTIAGKCVKTGRQIALKVARGYSLLKSAVQQIHLMFPVPT